jgi:hypothetical protein
VDPRRAVAAALVVAASSLPAACSALVDTNGLSEGPSGAFEGGADDRDGAPGDAPDAPDAAASTDANVDGDAGTSRYAAAVLADAPLLYYRFREKDGIPARDEVSGATTAYPVAGFTYGVPGPRAGEADTAVKVDGSQFLALTQAAAFEAAEAILRRGVGRYVGAIYPVALSEARSAAHLAAAR